MDTVTVIQFNLMMAQWIEDNEKMDESWAPDSIAKGENPSEICLNSSAIQ